MPIAKALCGIPNLLRNFSNSPITHFLSGLKCEGIRLNHSGLNLFILNLCLALLPIILYNTAKKLILSIWRLEEFTKA
jgi:hypothetical protein